MAPSSFVIPVVPYKMNHVKRTDHVRILCGLSGPKDTLCPVCSYSLLSPNEFRKSTY